ncbi:MAG TPA: PAS domain S-box protein, partial [Ignavibacteria bacterium]|nr:PAS domain S-box protein [Ignavibacteria bacterium]
MKSEYFLSEAQRIAHIGSYELDVATGSWTSSDELYQIFGIDQNYNKNIETWKNILHPEDKEAIFAYLQNDVLTAHQTFNREYRIIRVSDNEERWVHGLGELEFDTNGNPVKMIGTIQDITERKQAEERIARFSRIFEDSLNEIYLFESDTLKFIQVNKAAQNNLGYTMAELKELTPLDLKPEFTTELFTNLIAPLRKGEKENIVFETVHKRKDQSLYNVEIHLQLLEFEHEAFFAAIILDITERKKNEEKITQKNKQLLLLSKASTEINKVLDIKIILQQLVKIAIELTGSTSGVAALYEDDKMVFTTYNNKGKIIPIDFKFEKGYGVPGWIIKTKKPYITNDAKNDKYVIQKIRERLNFHQLIDIPILNKKGELLGCFEIFNTIDKRPYNEQDIEIMQGLSASAAVAIENAQIILERKKTEMALKTSNEFNESLIETIPFGLDIVDLEGNVLFMNNLLKDTVGIENPKGKCWEFYKDSGKQCTECPLKDEMELGETNIYEIHNVFGGREYEITYTVMNYKNQKAMLEIFRDITESKKAQKEILKLSRGIEQTPAMVVITDTDGNIEFINPKVTEFTGYSKEELIGKNPKIFQSGQTPQKTYKELWDTIIKGDTWEGEILNKRKNGELYWESVRISPIFNDEGELINFLGIKVDITENIKARDELLAAKEKAEETNKLKSNFLANMSHELRTPMVGIIGFIEILEEEIKKPKLKEYASFVHEASSRLMETLNLILNLTKIEAEKINIELSKIDVIQNMKRAIKTFDKIAAKKNIYLRFESDIKKFETETDERIFDQIISNLVNNAVKYTKRGGVTVSVNKIKNDTYLEIKVKDTGIGIPKDKQELIWEDFRQVSEGMARLYEGTGLGLTITNNFVNKLGGEIKLESGLSKGSTFTVLLPVRAKSISTKTKEQTSNKKTGTPKTKNKQEKLKTLLYFEDDKISLEAIPLFLKGR